MICLFGVERVVGLERFFISFVNQSIFFLVHYVCFDKKIIITRHFHFFICN